MEPRPSPIDSLKRSWPWLVLFVALAAVHLTCVSNEPGGNLGGDSAIYVQLGKALATGQGYVDLYRPGHPPHTKYPFVFPLLIAACQMLFERPVLAVHVVLALLNALAATLLGRWAGRRTGSPVLGLGLGLAAGTLPLIYLQSLHLLSEVPFMALAFGALELMPGEREEPAGKSRLAALAVVCLGAYFTRSAGAVLLGAAVYDLWRSRSRVGLGGREFPAWPVLGGLFFLAALAWALRNHLAGGESSAYVGEFFATNPSLGDWTPLGVAGFGRRLVDNFTFYVQVMGEGAFSPAWAGRIPDVGYVVMAGWLIGLVRESRQGPRGAEVFTVGFVLLTLAWPFQEKRLLLPVFPLVLYYLLRALTWPVERLGGEVPARWAAGAVLAALVLVQGVLLKEQVALRFDHRPEPAEPVKVQGYGEWKTPVIDFANYNMQGRRYEDLAWTTRTVFTDYLITCSLCRDLTPPGSVIMCRKPMWVYWFSERESIPPPRGDDPDLQWQAMVDGKVDYVIFSFFENNLGPLFKQDQERGGLRFEVVTLIERSNTMLIKVKHEASP